MVILASLAGSGSLEFFGNLCGKYVVQQCLVSLLFGRNNDRGSPLSPVRKKEITAPIINRALPAIDARTQTLFLLVFCGGNFSPLVCFCFGNRRFPLLLACQ
jgi:hypothetical protein